MDNRLLGVIKLGDPLPGNLSPLYRGQLLVHGLGFSPDHRTLVAVSIGSNSVSFIDTATNSVKRTVHVTKAGTFAYVTVGGTNQVKVFRTDAFSQVAAIPVGRLPHGLWPSGDGTRMYVGLENADGVQAP